MGRFQVVSNALAVAGDRLVSIISVSSTPPHAMPWPALCDLLHALAHGAATQLQVRNGGALVRLRLLCLLHPAARTSAFAYVPEQPAPPKDRPAPTRGAIFFWQYARERLYLPSGRE